MRSFALGKKILSTIASALLCVFIAALVQAQTGTSSVRGTVTDPQGNAVAGASITLSSTTKSFSRTQVTSGDGQFTFVAIPPDTYSVAIEATGFKKSVVPAVQALVDTPKVVDVALEIGQVS